MRDTAQMRIPMFVGGMVFDDWRRSIPLAEHAFERLNDFLAQIPTLDFPVKRAFRAIAAPCMELTD